MVKIIYEEIDDENFSAFIEFEFLNVVVEGTTWTDQEDELCGDQVSATHTIAYFDRITDMKIFDSRDREYGVISLDFAKFIESKLNDDMAESIDQVNHEVNYSPKYYDLI